MTSSKTLAPIVQTAATPDVEWLLQARADCQEDSTLKGLFKDHTGDALVVQLTARLAGLWDGQWEEAKQVAQYLADEYSQIGDAVLLVSTETGRAVARIREEDIYQPGPVLRESGDVTLALPQLEPGKEAFLVSWIFEQGREAKILSALAAKPGMTELLRQTDNPRLWIATRAGRERLSSFLEARDPLWLLKRSGGTVGAFLSHWEIYPAFGVPPTEDILKLQSRSAIRVDDPLTTNLGYDHLGMLQASAANGWVMDLALQLSRKVHTLLPPTSKAVREVDTSLGTWVTDPDTAANLIRRKTSRILAVDGAKTIGMSGKVGELRVWVQSFRVNRREVFGRLEVSTTLEVDALIPDRSVFQSIEVIDVPRQSHVL